MDMAKLEQTCKAHATDVGTVEGRIEDILARMLDHTQAPKAACTSVVGHRPRSTSVAVVSMVAESRHAAQVSETQMLQAQLDAFKAQAEHPRRHAD